MKSRVSDECFGSSSAHRGHLGRLQLVISPTSASAYSSPPPMPNPKPNRTRERRIIDEIVVDAYNEEERAMGWHCYLDEQLYFPFQATCITERTISPLKKGEEVTVIAMAHEDDCMREMFVRI